MTSIPACVQRLHHRAELVAGMMGIDRVLLVRGEEVEGHVPPVVALLRIELLHGEQLDHRDTQLLQVGDLIDDPGVGPPPLGGEPAGRAPREAADVHLVDDGVRLVAGRSVITPGEGWVPNGQDAKRRPAQVGARPLRGLAIEPRREEDRLGVRIEQDLLGVEGMPVPRSGWSRPVDLVGVVAGAADLMLSQSTMPDMPRLVHPGIESMFEQGLSRVVLAEEEQRHALRMLGSRARSCRRALPSIHSRPQGKDCTIGRRPS